MPHVRPQEYKKADPEYKLEYIELVCRLSRASRNNDLTNQIHRHHKRTPYASNTFPTEQYPWYCSDEGLFYYGEPLNPTGNLSAPTYWDVYTTSTNPFPPEGFNGTCQFPQITRDGLDDSWQHGKDLYSVYHDLLGFLPSEWDSDTVAYRVTNNVITSQVAGMVVKAMYPQVNGPFPLLIQPDSIDSLEPAYSCSAGSTLYSTYSVGGTNPNWTAHLTDSATLFSTLNSITGVDGSNSGWADSWDHYFDNLSSKQCHDKPLPCNITHPTDCVTQAQADEVYRLGEYEYSFVYRAGGADTLLYSTEIFGVYVAELAQNIRNTISGASKIKYKHNIAHDGSVSPLLSILQIDNMVWPGMGSEVVFEVYSKGYSNYFLRVLWGGQVLTSSNPSLGAMDMVPLNTFLAYIDGLAGVGASKVPGLCNGS
jgi:acid phosphatase